MKNFQKGAFFGVAAVFSNQCDYVTTIEAKTQCNVLFIDEKLLQELIKNHYQIAENYIRYLTSRINILNQKIDSFSANDCCGKLALFLLKEYDKNENLNFDLKISLTLLASSLNLGRASLYRAFEQLENENIIQKNGKNITILSPKGLEKYKQE